MVSEHPDNSRWFGNRFQTWNWCCIYSCCASKKDGKANQWRGPSYDGRFVWLFGTWVSQLYCILWEDGQLVSSLNFSCVEHLQAVNWHDFVILFYNGFSLSYCLDWYERKAVPWLRRLVISFWPWRPGFIPGQSLLDKVALGLDM
jgi:hypothetical protein